MIPNVWRQAILHPIPKSEKQTIDPLQYRGLALQSCIYKVLSNIINARIVNHFETHGHIADEQNGFHKKRSCIHHIHTLTYLARNLIAENRELFVCFIDFRKAFDVVNRDLLYCHLVEYGIHGNILDLIKQMYQDTSSVIRLNGLISDSFISESGVKQGDNLSPTMFNGFINGLLTELNDIQCGVEVDNIVVNNLG